jgi:hypothetical protein
MLLLFRASLLLFIALICTLQITLISSYLPNYNYYHNLTGYYQHIKQLQSKYADYVSSYQGTQLTQLNHPLILLQLTSPQSNYAVNSAGQRLPKRKLLLSFGEHSRELIVIESFFDLMNYLLQGALCDTARSSIPCSSVQALLSTTILSHLDLHLLGLVNPDGKFLLEKNKNYCQRNNAANVDLNRNADWQFGGPGSSKLPNHEEYHGAAPFSEVETQFILELANKFNYTGYFSLHSGEKQIFSPFVDTESSRTKRRRSHTADDLQLINEILSTTNNYFHHSGIGYEMNSYAADGTIYDWFAGRRNIKYALCAELYGDSNPQNEKNKECFTQFNPDNHELQEELVKIRHFYLSLFVHLIHLEYNYDYNALLANSQKKSSERSPKFVKFAALQHKIQALQAEMKQLTG